MPNGNKTPGSMININNDDSSTHTITTTTAATCKQNKKYEFPTQMR